MNLDFSLQLIARTVIELQNIKKDNYYMNWFAKLKMTIMIDQIISQIFFFKYWQTLLLNCQYYESKPFNIEITHRILWFWEYYLWKKIIIVLIYCIFNVNTCPVGYFLCRKNNGYRSGTVNILVDKSPIYLTFFQRF